jgi:hypothetical protein
VSPGAPLLGSWLAHDCFGPTQQYCGIGYSDAPSAALAAHNVCRVGARVHSHEYPRDARSGTTVAGAAERQPGGAEAGDARWSVVQQAPLSKDAASAMAALRSAGLYAPAPWAAAAASTGATVCRELPVDQASESRHRWVHHYPHQPQPYPEL